MIYSYKFGSASAKALSEQMGIKRICHKNSKYKGGEHKIVINWGSSKLPDEVLKSMIINNPMAVKIASNKLEFFKHFDTVEDAPRLPEYTEDEDVAKQWFEEGHCVVGPISVRW